MRKGSITVFLALVLVLVLSFLFSLLEGARLACMKSRARLVSELSMKSMFGNYHAGVWEDYHLLFLDGSWQEGEFSMDRFVERTVEEVRQNLTAGGQSLWGKSWDLTKLSLQSMTVEGYELATDQEGGVFQGQVALQMKLEAAGNVLDELLSVQEQGSGAESRAEESEQSWENAWDAMEQAEEQAREQAENGQEEPENGQGEPGSGQEEPEETVVDVPEVEIENPMEYVKELKRSTVLALAVQDVSEVSKKALEDTDFIAKRQLQQGSWQQAADAGTTDRLWLQYYIQNYFSNYTEKSGNGPTERVLDYEMEYLVAGKESDSENLESVIYRLLGLRESMNFVTIMKDSAKRSLALSIATAAVGFTGILPLVKAVQLGVLLAWAFVESVLDVRGLLEGKKIPFLKRADQWSSDLTASREVIESGEQAKSDGEGLSYTQYLQILLFLLSGKTLCYRCMDLIERNEGIRMDHMLQAVKAGFQYEGTILFWRMNFLQKNSWDSLRVPGAAQISYGAG